MSPAAWIAALAYLKARAGLEGAAAARLPEPLLVLAADTVCVVDGRLIGQPRDAEHAREIIRLFENRSHDVLTGVALVRADGWRDLFADRARVRLGPLGPGRLEEYLATGLWRGKAGAYNLEDRLAAGWPIEFDGDPTTVVGLPMRALLPRLRAAAGAAAGEP